MNLQSRLFFVPLFVLSLVSCTHGYRIKGTSSEADFDGKQVSLKALRNGQWVTVDSTDVLHGNFAMKGQTDSVMLVALFLDDESILPLVLEEGEITVSIGQTQFTAKGTPLNDALTGFIQQQNSYQLRLGEVRTARENDLLQEEMNDYVKGFITSNYENVLGPGVFMMMCSMLSYPVITPQIEEILEAAPTSFKENPTVKEYLNKARENMKLLEEHERLHGNMAARN